MSSNNKRSLTSSQFKSLLISFAILLSAIALFFCNPVSAIGRRILPVLGFVPASTVRVPSTVFQDLFRISRFSSAAVNSTMALPVYFWGHGGPNVMFETQHPAYGKLGKIGREINEKVKPKAVVVVSAHWQAGGGFGLGGSGNGAKVLVNVGDGDEGLIYDFYGFPKYYYDEKFPYKGNKELAGDVMVLLQKAGFAVEPVKRGLDHGVWASFKCAFDPELNPLNVPIVQVSLPSTDDPITHYRMGQALSALRAAPYNALIVGSGMAVHNLRDYMFDLNDKPQSYTISFDEALKDAVESDPADREDRMAKLLQRSDVRKAHPTLEHLWPIFFAAGAGSGDRGKRIWTLKEGSMSWAQYKFSSR